MARSPHLARLAARGVRGIEPYVPGKPLDELERELGVRDAIKLASNENPLGPSPRAVAAMTRAIGDAALYPDGGAFRLKAALARRVGAHPEQVTIGNGSNELLVLIAEAFLGSRTEAVYSQYGFLVYSLAVQATGATGKVAPALGPGSSQPLGHDLDAMAALVGPRTRVVYIANPNNPTGTWLGAQALREFLETLPRSVIVALDEAYCEYAEAPDYPTPASWISAFPNLVITRTFSKIYGLAGLRVGYAISHPQVADLLNRVRQPFNVNSVGQAAALAALEDEEHVARSREVNRLGQEQLAGGLAALGVAFSPSAGNFLLLDLGRPAQPIYELLLRAGVIVRPVANYGLTQHLRVTVGTAGQNERMLAALAHALGAGGTGA